MATEVTIPTGLAINSNTSSERATPNDFRRAFAALFKQSAPGVVVAGIIPAPNNPLGVQTSASAMTYHVNPGFALTTRSGGGAYINGTNDPSGVTLTPPVGNATQPRYDRIFIVQPDPELSETGVSRIGVVSGTPASSPTLPALPTGALELARKLVPAGASNTSTGTGLTNLPTTTALNVAVTVDDVSGLSAAVASAVAATTGSAIANASTTVTEATDWDTLTNPGIYRVNASTAWTSSLHAPMVAYPNSQVQATTQTAARTGTLIVTEGTDQNGTNFVRTQLFVPSSSGRDGNLWKRTLVSGTWGEWVDGTTTRSAHDYYTLATNADWNNITLPGNYRVNGTSSMVNGPGSSVYGFGQLVVQTSGAPTTESVTQVYYPATTGEVWTRSKFSTSDWSSWKYLPDDVPRDRGTVVANIDWNLVTLPGSYRVSGSGWSGTNQPTKAGAANGLLIVTTGNTSVVSQVFYPQDAGEHWFRVRSTDGTTWTTWATSNGPGTLIGVWDVWGPADQIVASQTISTTPFNVSTYTIPDPGVPFRAQISLQYEASALDASTRWDMGVGCGGSGTTFDSQLGVLKWGTQWRTVEYTTAWSETLTGTRVWRLEAHRFFGTANFSFYLNTRKFQIRYYTA